MTLEGLRAIACGPVIAVRLNPGEQRFAVAKLFLPGLENPPGARRLVQGGRALGKMLVFR
jgi:hypothetical protein